MKQISITLLLFIFIFATNAQDFKMPVNENGEIEYREIVQTNLSSNQLFANAKEWIAKTFGDYKKVLQYEDTQNFKVIIKGKIPTNEYINNYGGLIIQEWSEIIDFTLTIECKDKRYRYIIDGISLIKTERSSVMGSVPETATTTESLLEKKNTDLDYQNKIAESRFELDSIKNIDISKLKKKALKEHQKRLRAIEGTLAGRIKSKIENIDRFENNKKAILNLITDMKKELGQDNNF